MAFVTEGSKRANEGGGEQLLSIRKKDAVKRITTSRLTSSLLSISRDDITGSVNKIHLDRRPLNDKGLRWKSYRNPSLVQFIVEALGALRSRISGGDWRTKFALQLSVVAARWH